MISPVEMLMFIMEIPMFTMFVSGLIHLDIPDDVDSDTRIRMIKLKKNCEIMMSLIKELTDLGAKGESFSPEFEEKYILLKEIREETTPLVQTICSTLKQELDEEE